MVPAFDRALISEISSLIEYIVVYNTVYYLLMKWR